MVPGTGRGRNTPYVTPLPLPLIPGTGTSLRNLLKRTERRYFVLLRVSSLLFRTEIRITQVTNVITLGYPGLSLNLRITGDVTLVSNNPERPEVVGLRGMLT